VQPDTQRDWISYLQIKISEATDLLEEYTLSILLVQNYVKTGTISKKTLSIGAVT